MIAVWRAIMEVMHCESMQTKISTTLYLIYVICYMSHSFFCLQCWLTHYLTKKVHCQPLNFNTLLVNVTNLLDQLKHKWNLHLCNFYHPQAKLQSVWITTEMTGFHRAIINVLVWRKSFFPKWREVILVDLKVQPHLPLPSETSQANSSHLNRNSSNREFCVRVERKRSQCRFR